VVPSLAFVRRAPLPATLFAVGLRPTGMTWGDLFERAAAFDVSEADVRAALRRHRDE
jgi:hypothetical protein